MLRGIDLTQTTSRVSYVSRPAFKAEDEPGKNISLNFEFNAADAISNYNKAHIGLSKKISITPLIPTVFNPNYTNAINGERIYTSDGKLYSIVDENEKLKTVYTPNKEDTRFFDSIITTDKETGNVIRRQNNIVEDGKYAAMMIREYSPENGKIAASTSYKNGKAIDCTKYVYKDNGDIESVSYLPEDDVYYWDKTSSDGKEIGNITISNDLRFGTLDFRNIKQGREISYSAKFYNGGLISLSETNKLTVPNLLGREPLDDDDLKPAEKFDLSTISYDIESDEKTYYSNGAVESIIFPFGTIEYTPDGNISKLSADTKQLRVLPDGTQIIEEKLDDNITKTTAHYSDNTVEVKYQNGNHQKILVLNENNQPISYKEGRCDDEGCTDTMSLYYNKSGLLESAYNF